MRDVVDFFKQRKSTCEEKRLKKRKIGGENERNTMYCFDKIWGLLVQWNKLSCVGSARVVWAGCNCLILCSFYFCGQLELIHLQADTLVLEMIKFNFTCQLLYVIWSALCKYHLFLGKYHSLNLVRMPFFFLGEKKKSFKQ